MNRLKTRLKEIGDESGKPDFLVVSGDIVDGPRWRRKHHSDFLRSCLHRLRSLCDLLVENTPQRLRVAVGNHDLKASGLVRRGFTLSEFSDVFHQHLGIHADRTNKILFASFNTNFKSRAIETATGTASVSELAAFNSWLASESDEIKRFPRVAVLHHHPMPVAESEAQPRTLIDPTDYLRLRNAGTLLKRLIESGFHVVLHGHLHAPEHWSVSTAFSVSRSAEMRPLEIIGAGSAGKAGPDDKYSLNMVSVFELGWVHASRHDFADHGGKPEALDLVRRNFEFVRPTIAAAAHLQTEWPFRCTATDIDVLIHPRSGLVESDTKHFALRSRSKESRNEFPIRTRFNAVTNRPNITARSLETGTALHVAQQDQSSDAGYSNFTHQIDVSKIGSLTRPHDVAYLIRTSARSVRNTPARRLVLRQRKRGDRKF